MHYNVMDSVTHGYDKAQKRCGQEGINNSQCGTTSSNQIPTHPSRVLRCFPIVGKRKLKESLSDPQPTDNNSKSDLTLY